MNFRTILILITLLFVTHSVDYVTGDVQFSLGLQNEVVKIPKIQNPLVILALNDVNYKNPFSLNLHSRIITRDGEQYLTLTSDLKNTTYYNSIIQIAVKYLVSPQLKGFKMFTFRLSGQNPQYTIQTRGQNLQNLKKGYFVTGFSSNGILDLVSTFLRRGDAIYVVLNTADQTNWVEVNFVLLDLSAVTGCPTHNIHNGTVNSLHSAAIQQFDFVSKDSSELIIGLSTIKSFNGTFQWDDGQLPGTAIALGKGSFTFVAMQLDTQCAISNFVNPIIPLDVISRPGITLTDNAGNMFDMPIYYPTNNNNQQLYWNTQNRPVSNQMPFNPQQINQQNTFYPPLPTIIPFQTLKQLFGQQSPQTIPINDNTQQQNFVPIVPLIPKIEPIVDNQPQVVQSQLSTTDKGIFQQSVTHPISAWKVLGFVVLAWIAISILAIPLLCCLLWRSRKRQQQQDQIIKKYVTDEIISEPAQDFIDRGTDVRLRNHENIEMKQIKPQVEHITYTKQPSVVGSKNIENITQPSQIKVSATPVVQQSNLSQTQDKSSIIKQSKPNNSKIEQVQYGKPQIRPTTSQIKVEEQIKYQNENSIQQESQHNVPSQIKEQSDNKSQIKQIQKIDYAPLPQPSVSQTTQQIILQTQSPLASEIKQKQSIQSSKKSEQAQQNNTQQIEYKDNEQNQQQTNKQNSEEAQNQQQNDQNQNDKQEQAQDKENEDKDKDSEQKDNNQQKQVEQGTQQQPKSQLQQSQKGETKQDD